MWVISNGYSTPTNELKRYPDRSMQYFEPDTIENRKIDDECPLFCKDYRTPFYVKETGGCGMFDSTNSAAETLALGDYMFCPDMGTIKPWTIEDELEFKALLEYLETLHNSEYEVLKEMRKERKLRLSIYPWKKEGTSESLDVDNFRRFQVNGTRRLGSARSFKCFGGSGGGFRRSLNRIAFPYAVYVRHGRLIDRLEFSYSMGKVQGGGWGGRPSRFTFHRFSHSCIMRVNLRSGRLVDGIQFVGARLSSPWYGGRGGHYHSITAPWGRCLGEVQMRTGRLVDQICFKFNAYRCLSYCKPPWTKVCERYGVSKPRCKRCTRCKSNYYEYRRCTGNSNTICRRCRSKCKSNEYELRRCNGISNRVCRRCRSCKSGQYQVALCTRRHDRICRTCSNCNSITRRKLYYEVRSCTTRSNTVCGKCKRCSRDQYISRKCTSSQNTVCERWHKRICPNFPSGYFSQRHIDEIFIIMTHNSLAVRNKVWSPNQNHGLVTQFRDGVRGFTFDLFMDGDNLMTKHDTGVKWKKQYDPSDEIRDLVRELGKKENAGEFIIIQLESYIKDNGNKLLTSLFGDKLVKNFDSRENFGHYLWKCQQVLIFSDRNWEESIGIHSTRPYIIENDYKWKHRYSTPPLGKRERSGTWTEAPRPMRLMNYFCCGSGDMMASHEVHNTGRALKNIKKYESKPYFGRVNALMVDYYRTGFKKKGVYEIFIVQYVMRHGGSSGLNPGALCPYTVDAMCRDRGCGKRSKDDPTYICCHINRFSFWGIITFSDFCK